MAARKSRRVPRLLWLVIAAVLMVMLSGFLGVWYPYQREQAAITEIRHFRGQKGLVEVSFTRHLPRWLLEWRGGLRIFHDYRLRWFNRVRYVDLSDSKITDDGMKHLRELPHLTALRLQRTQITDAGLDSLGKLYNLKSLTLSETQITDAGLASLINLPNLKSLRLSDSRISDKGLVHLARLKQLTDLGLYDTKVTEDGVRRLQEALPHCEILY